MNTKHEYLLYVYTNLCYRIINVELILLITSYRQCIAFNYSNKYIFIANSSYVVFILYKILYRICSFYACTNTLFVTVLHVYVHCTSKRGKIK